MGGEEPTYGDLVMGNSGANQPGVSGTVRDFVSPTLYQRMSYTHIGALVGATANGDNTLSRAPKRAYIPMTFWFCRNPGLAIPLIALQYHEVKFNINFDVAM